MTCREAESDNTRPMPGEILPDCNDPARYQGYFRLANVMSRDGPAQECGELNWGVREERHSGSYVAC
jgi:hypothetical protein